MPQTTTVIFDFIGTLTNVKGYDMEESKKTLHKAIVNAGFDISATKFLQAYDEAHEKHRIVRYEKLTEVTNAVWIAEALRNLGFETTKEDARILTALCVFFEEYVNSLELRPCAKQLLTRLVENYKLGLISNFTYAAAIYAGLRKLDINKYFNAVLVSEAVGWRKPHTGIFQEALRALQATPSETVYVGDSPLEDIKGAKSLGMKTVFVPSQFYSLKSLRESQQKPDLIVKDICELSRRLPKLLEH